MLTKRQLQTETCASKLSQNLMTGLKESQLDFRILTELKHALLVTNVKIKLTRGMSQVKQKLDCLPHNLKINQCKIL